MKFRSVPGIRQAIILLLLVFIVAGFSRSVRITSSFQPAIDTGKIAYAGSAVCARCHKEISASHRLTAHFRTSSRAEDSTISGSFQSGKNEFRYSESLFIRMEKRSDSFYQVLYAAGEQSMTARFGLVVGSGTKGQTYLYWGENNTLFEMPVSYFTPGHTWSNSPGYPGIPIFDRKVTPRCLECHTSSAVQTNSQDAGAQAEYDPDGMMLGVDCERCHGPASGHVAWHTAHPSDTIAHDLVRLAGFSRKQKLDLCRFCHGGSMPLKAPSFTYMPGDDLDRFFAVDSVKSKAAGIDVHGNQYGLMVSSRCFKESDLTCVTCHDSHREERDQLSLFASRCQSCHRQDHVKTCALTGKVTPEILINCVDCHMPRQSSKAITMYLPGQNHETAAMMRTHKIAVYPDATDSVFKRMGNGVNRSGLTRVFDMHSGKWHYQ